MLNDYTISIILVLAISLLLNIFFVIYAKKFMLRLFNASESISEIFTRIDAFQDHLKTVYEMPTFYGDETLQGLLEHAKSFKEHLMLYEDITSLTQPDLLEQLQIASEDSEENHDEETEA